MSSLNTTKGTEKEKIVFVDPFRAGVAEHVMFTRAEKTIGFTAIAVGCYHAIGLTVSS